MDPIQHLLDLQRTLAARIEALDGNPAEVVALGPDVIEFAQLEEQCLFPMLPLLDPSARDELGDEHYTLAEHLHLLEHLLAANPDSSDAEILASALTKRLRAHIARDGRLLAQALRLGPAAVRQRAASQEE